MWYESRKKNDIIICALYCSIEDVLSSEEVKGHQFNLGGENTLPLCDECIKHKITPPTGVYKAYGEVCMGENSKGETVWRGCCHMYQKTDTEGGKSSFNAVI